MNTPTLPEHIGGLQHLAPDAIAHESDIYVLDGKPNAFVGRERSDYPVASLEGFGYNIYRRIPVAKRGDLDHPPVVSDGTERDKLPGVIAARALGCSALPTDAKARKQIPLASGLLDYFPLALCAVAELSRIGSEQHNPGKPLHWDRSKSGDEADALMRHLLQRNETDKDGVEHAVKCAWRALALAQKRLEGLKK